ncbi:MAG: metallophosphoesterase family protein [Microthrixaceae bacterium]
MSDDPVPDATPEPTRHLPATALRALFMVVRVAVLGTAVLLLAPRLGTATETVGPGSLAIRFEPATSGRTVLALPPIGTASAATHRGPVQVSLELRSLRVESLFTKTGTIDRDAIGDSVRRDLTPALTHAAVRLVLTAALVGLVASLALFRRRPRTALIGLLGGAVIGGALAGSTAVGFDPKAFDELTYSGPITSGRQMLAAVSGSAGPIAERASVLAEKVSSLYSVALSDRIADSEADTVILHISDLHLNPLGAQLARRLAADFDVDAVLDTGDTTSFGTRFEGVFADQLADFGVPYLYVAGNHDTDENRTAIKSKPGVLALDRTEVTVGSVRIVGFDDPVITQAEPVTLTQRNRRQRNAFPALRRIVAAEHPDLVAVHDPFMIGAVAGRVKAAVAGHGHRTRLGVRDDTVAWMVGSTGATGLGSLLVEADLPSSAALLRFRNGHLMTIDELEVIGTRGDLVIRRHTVSDPSRLRPADFLDEPIEEGTGVTTTTADEVDSTATTADPDNGSADRPETGSDDVTVTTR